jgi:hypothetical protein
MAMGFAKTAAAGCGTRLMTPTSVRDSPRWGHGQTQAPLESKRTPAGLFRAPQNGEWAMRNLVWHFVIGLCVFSNAEPVHAADGVRQDTVASPLILGIVFLSALLVILFDIFMGRRNSKLAQNSIKQFDEHRTLVEAHMRRLESQVESLDKRLIQIIELLERTGSGLTDERMKDAHKL